MKEESALADSPEWSGAEHVAGSESLCDVVGESLTHVMNQQVGVRMRGDILERGGFALWRSDHGWGVAGEASDAGIAGIGAEELLAANWHWEKKRQVEEHRGIA